MIRVILSGIDLRAGGYAQVSTGQKHILGAVENFFMLRRVRLFEFGVNKLPAEIEVKLTEVNDREWKIVVEKRAIAVILRASQRRKPGR